MKIFILGASGATGLTLTKQAIDAGHQVTAYVRTPNKLLDFKNKITIIQGELSDEKKLTEALAGQEAVMSTLGYKKIRDQSLFIHKAMKIVLTGMEKHGISKLVYESAFGIGGKDSISNFFIRNILKAFGIINPFRDHFETEKIIRQSNVNWTIARPGLLTKGPLHGKYRAQVGLKGLLIISRADVAHFMLDALSNKNWSNKAVDLGY